jgi:phytoene dehydrogenase-like protein
MDFIELSKTIADVGAIVVFGALIVTVLLMTKASVDAILKERDKADTVRDARLQDQKDINRDLVQVTKDSAEALRRLADAWEARNRAEADTRRNPNV